MLYAQDTNGSTPNRTALHRVGRYYAGDTDGINNGMTPDPIEYLLPAELRAPHDRRLLERQLLVDRQRGQHQLAATRRGPIGAYDGALTGAVQHARRRGGLLLQDGPAHLRPGVPEQRADVRPRDQNPTQHMVTFTLGLGLEGFMDYQSDYETSLTGDFAKIKAGTNNACSWTTRHLQLAGAVRQRPQHARRPVARGGQRARQVLQRERPELAHAGAAAGARRR